ncbi:MAG: Gfo/Idh/MocA family oxidoreductase [Planctomyces sp.]|nr:Gfo/Idh/MocA family oxidoreductase [Planctomyces sp.]
MSGRSNRRGFLKSSAAGAGSLFAAPLILPSRVFGANERVAVASIGVRNQGGGNLKRFLDAGTDVVAVCDVDSKVAGAAAETVMKSGVACQIYGDYRKLLERTDLDAVVITTPDHWHALMTIHACQAGKDVYCEKPLSLTIAEGRRMVKAAREHSRIVQTGSQQRSSAEFWKACMLVRNGMLGEVQSILVGIPDPNHPGPIGPEEQVPAELNYDMWLGPAPFVPYHSKRVHYNFRFWWDYSGGQITNFGAHHLDIVQWALGMDNSGPVSAEGTAGFHPDKVHEVTESCRITYTYGNGVKVVLGQRQDDIPEGVTFIGSKGRVVVGRGRVSSTPSEIAETSLEDSSLIQLVRSTDHTQNFLESVKTRELPICDVEIGHRSATVCHLGNLVARLGRPIKWDPVSELIVGDAEAQAMTDRVYRETR